MQETKSTPGPWYFEPEQLDHTRSGAWGLPTIIQRAKVIIPEHFDSEANDSDDVLELRLEANARLIAAGPEMLRELQGIGHQTQITTEHFNRIQRLIAKATGSETA